LIALQGGLSRYRKEKEERTFTARAKKGNQRIYDRKGLETGIPGKAKKNRSNVILRCGDIVDSHAKEKENRKEQSKSSLKQHLRNYSSCQLILGRKAKFLVKGSVHTDVITSGTLLLSRKERMVDKREPVGKEKSEETWGGMI